MSCVGLSMDIGVLLLREEVRLQESDDAKSVLGTDRAKETHAIGGEQLPVLDAVIFQTEAFPTKDLPRPVRSALHFVGTAFEVPVSPARHLLALEGIQDPHLGSGLGLAPVEGKVTSKRGTGSPKKA